nr:hypothetical protein [Variovorax sp. PAMC 28711]
MATEPLPAAVAVLPTATAFAPEATAALPQATSKPEPLVVPTGAPPTGFTQTASCAAASVGISPAIIKAADTATTAPDERFPQDRVSSEAATQAPSDAFQMDL